MLRARLLRLGPEEHVALVTMHHIVSDGWSQAVLIREVGALYAAAVTGRPSPLAETAIQYADSKFVGYPGRTVAQRREILHLTIRSAVFLLPSRRQQRPLNQHHLPLRPPLMGRRSGLRLLRK